jgi:hypothetical protein
MPIFGITASSNQFAKLGDFFQIATTTVGSGGTSSINFNSIPQTYTHLQIRGIWKVSSSGVLKMQFNSDTGANYKAHYLAGDGSTAYANVTSVSPNAVGIGYVGASTAFMVSVCDILDYTNTNKNTTIRCLNGNDRNGAGDVEIDSGVWLNTAAITSITLTPQTGTLSEYSSLALYGIKG